MVAHFKEGDSAKGGADSGGGSGAYEEMLSPVELLRHYVVKGRHVSVDAQAGARAFQLTSKVANPHKGPSAILALKSYVLVLVF